MSTSNHQNSDTRPLKHHVLVVDKDPEFGQALSALIAGEHVRSKHSESVDAFLDSGCRARIDLVLLEIDVFDPAALDDLRLLRTHFGEGPNTRIVAVTAFAPAEFPRFLQQWGADTHLPRLHNPESMQAAISAEIAKLADLTALD